MVAEDLLKKLYKKKSLQNNNQGFQIQLTNPLSDAKIIKPAKVNLGDEKFKDFLIEIDGKGTSNLEISEGQPLEFNVKSIATLKFPRETPLAPDKYTLKFNIVTEQFGELKFKIKDRIKE